MDDHAGPAMLRISTFPAERSAPTQVRLAPGDLAARERYLRELTADPVVREAIAVASSSLSTTLDALHAGRAVDPKKVRRACLAATSYLLRMTTRPTPFGLMAGVASTSFGE